MHVRTATEAAPGNPDNEDRAVHHGRLVGVLDGVSHPSDLDSGCVHSVAWYVETLSRHLIQVADRLNRAPLTDLLSTAIASTAADHAGPCDLTNAGTPAAAVGLIRASEYHLDYLLLCDTFLIVDDGHDIAVLTDPRFEQAIGPIRRDHLNGDDAFGSPQRQASLREATRQKQQLTNTDTGYWIAAANPDAAYHAVTGTLPLVGERAIRRAVLLTDGASRAVDTFALLSWREMIDLTTEHGPAELIQRVRTAEATHNSGVARLRFKKHDDATVALCQFT